MAKYTDKYTSHISRYDKLTISRKPLLIRIKCACPVKVPLHTNLNVYFVFQTLRKK